MKRRKLWILITCCLLLVKCFGGSSSSNLETNDLPDFDDASETNIQETGGPVSAPFPIAKGQDGMDVSQLTIRIGDPQSSSFDHSVTFEGDAGAVIDTSINDLRGYRESDGQEFEFLNVVDSDGSFPVSGADPVRIDSDSNDQVFLGPQAENGDVSFGVIVQPTANGDYIVALTNTSMLQSNSAIHLDVQGNLFMVGQETTSSSLTLQTTDSDASFVVIMNGTEVVQTLTLPDTPIKMTTYLSDDEERYFLFYLNEDGELKSVQLDTSEETAEADPETLETYSGTLGISFDLQSVFGSEDAVFVYYPRGFNSEGGDNAVTSMFQIRTDGEVQLDKYLYGRGDESLEAYNNGISFRFVQDEDRSDCEVTSTTFGCITESAAQGVGETCGPDDCAATDDPDTYNPIISEMSSEVTQMQIITNDSGENYLYYLDEDGVLRVFLYATADESWPETWTEAALTADNRIVQVGDDSVELSSFEVTFIDDKSVITGCTTNLKLAVLFKDVNDNSTTLAGEVANAAWQEHDYISCSPAGGYNVDENFNVVSQMLIGDVNSPQVITSPIFSQSILDELGLESANTDLVKFLKNTSENPSIPD